MGWLRKTLRRWLCAGGDQQEQAARMREMKLSIMRLGWLYIGVSELVALTIGQARTRRLDDETLQRIRRDAIRQFKNAQSVGLPIEDEAATWRQALDDFEQLIDAAIERTRHLGKGDGTTAV